MIVYIYDNNKKFMGSSQAQLDPLETERKGENVYILPANSTTIAPPAQKDGYNIIWNGVSWGYQEIPKPKEPDPYILTEEDLKRNKIGEIQARLTELSQDFVQANLGAVINDIESRKAEFKNLHNELRVLLGKQPRQYL